MKKSYQKVAVLCTGILISLCACQSEKEDIPTTPRENIPLTRNEEAIVESNQAFAFKLFREVNTEEIGKNILISPLSASLALSMTYNGADGITAEEMKSTLGFTDYKQDELNSFYKKLITNLLKIDRSTKLGIANSIWVKNEFKLGEKFAEINKDSYDAEISYLDFNNPSSVNIINKWCENKTKGKITNIIEEITPQQVMFLINALYFKGIWKKEFDKKNTSKMKFTQPNGSTQSIDMMQQINALAYRTIDEDLQIAELPYGNEAFSMVILLPALNKLENTIQQLTPENWNKWTKDLSERQVDIDLQLPKFKVEYEKELNDNLKKIGINAAFNPLQANFSKMTESQADLYIDFVKQKTYIEVDEKGSEAAAITTVAIVQTSPGPGSGTDNTFYVNRPFIYAIKEKSTGIILFMGKMESIN